MGTRYLFCRYKICNYSACKLRSTQARELQMWHLIEVSLKWCQVVRLLRGYNVDSTLVTVSDHWDNLPLSRR
jgi:hypothetical protein